MFNFKCNGHIESPYSEYFITTKEHSSETVILSTIWSVLLLTKLGLIFFIVVLWFNPAGSQVVSMGLCSGFVLKTVLITPACFSYR